MNFVPMIGSPPMPMAVLSADAARGQGIDDLVGERAGAADEADVAGRVDVSGMMPTFASPGVIRPGQLGPTRRAPVVSR